MPIQLNEENGGKMLAVHVSGKLAKADYEHFVPEFERLVRQHGKLRVLFDMAGFHGWEVGKMLVVHVSGKLAKADYEHFVPEFERLVRQHGKLRVLFDMAGFHGWE